MKTIKITMVLMLSMISLTLYAAPKVTMSLKAEAEVMVEENGKMVKKLVEVESVEPDQEVFYTISYTNSGDEVATNVNIKNKVPENSAYVVGSAWGENSEITFSVDDGKTYNKPSLLLYEVSNAEGEVTKKQISPEKYTDIQWVVKDIPSGESGKLGFKIKVN